MPQYTIFKYYSTPVLSNVTKHEAGRYPCKLTKTGKFYDPLLSVRAF